MKIAIVENEREPAALLSSFAERWSKERGVECVTQVFFSAVDFLSDYRADTDGVFLDIMMPMLDGMSAAEKLRQTDKNVQIVFVTNMAQFAIRGYKVGALDFLVKPVGYFDFSLEMNKIYNISRRKEGGYLYVNCMGALRRVLQSDISYIEIVNHNVVVHAGGEVLSYRGSLKEVESKLDEWQFSRCNNCFIVNLARVAAIEGDTALLDDGSRLSISRPRKAQFMSGLTAYIARVARGGV